MVLVVAEFHRELAATMVAAARDEAASSDAEVVEEIRVPGAYELPLTVQHVLEDRRPDALVALGFIEKGETLHGEVMGHVVHRSLVELELSHRMPMGLGLIGPGATPAQAEVRAEGSARSAVRAALALRGVLDG